MLAAAVSIGGVPGPPRYVVLDSLRGLCAMFVAIYHSRINSHVWGSSFVEDSYLFVDFFFVLSGFVIAANYQHRLRDGADIVAFMKLRWWRLYPLHLALLLAFVALEVAEALVFDGAIGGARGNAFGPSRSVESIPTNLLLIHSLGVHDSLTWNYPSWSISTEFYTYLLFAIVVVLTSARVVPVALTVALCAPVALGVLHSGAIGASWDYGLLRCVYGFACGVVVWNLDRRYPVSRAIAPRFATALELACAAGAFAYVAAAESLRATLAAPLVFAVCIRVFAAERGRVSAQLARRPILLLGAWSYAIYMVHLLVNDIGFGIARLVDRHAFPVLAHAGETLVGRNRLEGDLWLLAYLGAVVVVASATWRWIEMPWRDYGRRARSVRVVPAGGVDAIDPNA
jgi:peptidoglycan/LPS O-acetylase OafA/YrhL